MTEIFNDDVFAIADGVEQIDLTSGGPWRAIVRRITRTEQAETSLSADTVVFMIEPAATVAIGDTITRADESTYTIIKAQLRAMNRAGWYTAFRARRRVPRRPVC